MKSTKYAKTAGIITSSAVTVGASTGTIGVTENIGVSVAKKLGVNITTRNIGSSHQRKEFTPTSSNLSQYFTTTQGIRIT